MEIAEAKTKIIELRTELAQNEVELKEIQKIYFEYQTKKLLFENRKRDISKNI